MQRLAAYILERTDGLQQTDVRKAEGERLREVVEAWLRSKGATAVDGTGTYAAVDRSDARFRVSAVVDGERSWRMFELAEVTPEGRRFVTTVSVTVGHRSVVVFVIMEVGSVAALITQIDVDPKCPRVVRELLDQPGNWNHGSSHLHALTRVDGFEAGEALAQEIQHEDRTIPFVVVSRVQGQTSLPKLDKRLANDLAGVANVYSVDEDASWALTDILRKPFSTFAGAIRIYWPRLGPDDDPFRHQLWTATRLQGIETDWRTALERIRRQLRTIIMTASAASVVRPSEIDDIRGAAARSEYAALQAKASALDDLKAKASSLAEFKAIADSYASDNDALRQELSSRNSEIEQLREGLRELESDKQALTFQLGRARATKDAAAAVEPDAPEPDEADQPPTPGETRYYKKTHSAPRHDILVPVGDCGHNTWQGANKAEKAAKGLERLLGQHSNWKNLHHCGSCTGGGMWRVRW